MVHSRRRHTRRHHLREIPTSATQGEIGEFDSEKGVPPVAVRKRPLRTSKLLLVADSARRLAAAVVLVEEVGGCLVRVVP